MDNYTIVRQEHLNHYGFLFGGAMLKWVDEFAWLVASRDFPGCPLVTVGMDRISFRQPVANGSILRFQILPSQQGSTSISYAVNVFADAPGAQQEKEVFSTTVTFVHVDPQGRKLPLPHAARLRSQGDQSSAPPTQEIPMPHPVAAGKSSFDLIDPELVFSALQLQPDSVLLDLACGIGNYALAAADFIGPAGAIHAFDLWPEGIAELRARAEARGLQQVRAEVADVGGRLPLPEGSADVALLATVLHDLVAVGAGEGALREAARLLRPGGRLAIIEFEKVDSHPGPPAAVRLAPDQVEALVLPFGFRHERLTPVGNPLYLSVFVRQS